MIRIADTAPVDTLIDDPPPNVRLWRDNTGNFTAVAELLDGNTESVFLRRSSGNVVSVPLRRLSERDRDFVASSLAAK